MTKTEAGEPRGVDLQSLFDRLKHVCDSLEQPCSLKESMTLYEEGVALQKQIREELESAERRVVEIIDAEGTVTPFDDEQKRGPR